MVLGSATPSVESFAKAKSGEYTLLTLPDRISGRTLPTCEIVDLRAELRQGNRSILSRRLQELMADRLQKKERSCFLSTGEGWQASFLAEPVGM